MAFVSTITASGTQMAQLTCAQCLLLVVGLSAPPLRGQRQHDTVPLPAGREHASQNLRGMRMQVGMGLEDEGGCSQEVCWRTIVLLLSWLYVCLSLSSNDDTPSLITTGPLTAHLANCNRYCHYTSRKL